MLCNRTNNNFPHTFPYIIMNVLTFATLDAILLSETEVI